LIVTAFALGAGFGALGIRHDRRKWLAVLAGIIAGGFLLLKLWWSGLA
jgi:hypothetical protein